MMTQFCIFFVEKFNFFLTLTKKIGNIKKVLPIFQNCHNFSSFETVFFVFLHACQFCSGNHVFFNAVWRRVSCLIITCFFKIKILRGILWFLYFQILDSFSETVQFFWTVSVKLSSPVKLFRWAFSQKLAKRTVLDRNWSRKKWAFWQKLSKRTVSIQNWFHFFIFISHGFTRKLTNKNDSFVTIFWKNV